jgi:hypothetical protein
MCQCIILFKAIMDSISGCASSKSLQIKSRAARGKLLEKPHAALSHLDQHAVNGEKPHADPTVDEKQTAFRTPAPCPMAWTASPHTPDSAPRPTAWPIPTVRISPPPLPEHKSSSPARGPGSKFFCDIRLKYPLISYNKNLE